MRNQNPTVQSQVSLAEAAKILRLFVQHPNIRCFNYAEYAAATQALAAVDAEVAAQTPSE